MYIYDKVENVYEFISLGKKFLNHISCFAKYVKQIYKI